MIDSVRAGETIVVAYCRNQEKVAALIPYDQLPTQHHASWVNDLYIAGQARSRGLVLVTHNLREFQRMPGLLLENWSAE